MFLVFVVVVVVVLAVVVVVVVVVVAVVLAVERFRKNQNVTDIKLIAGSKNSDRSLTDE